MLGKLNSDMFAQYEKALSEVREELEKGNLNLDKDDLKNILKVYEWYKYDFKDIQNLAVQVSEIIRQQMPKLTAPSDREQTERLLNYLDCVIHKSYNCNVFTLNVRSLEMTALSIIDQLIEKMGDNMKDQITKLEEFKAYLMKIQVAYNISYLILKKIGNNFLDFISETIFSIPQTLQTFVLNALDNFKTDKNVMHFFNTYISKINNDWLKKEAEKIIHAKN